MTGPRSARPALLDRVRERLAAGDQGTLPGVVRQEAALLLDSVALAEMSGAVAANLNGAGPLESLLATPGVTDVLVNGARSMWFDCGSGLTRIESVFADDDEVRELAFRLAAQAGRRLDDASPFVDVGLPDGTRLHAILPPLVRNPTLSLRVLRRRTLSLDDLVRVGTVGEPVADVLRSLVLARLTVLISGGTGSGKTTLLSAVLSAAADHERLVTIEDAAELTIDHPHVLGLLARAPNLEGSGAVGLAELVRQALRMRVDRLIVGEFRGAELVDLLTALNTGHSGAATVHANSAADVPSRLIALAALGGMAPDVLRAQAASAVDVLVHLSRRRDGVRIVDEIALWPDDGVVDGSTTVWTADSGARVAAGVLAERLQRRGILVPPLLREGA